MHIMLDQEDGDSQLVAYSPEELDGFGGDAAAVLRTLQDRAGHIRRHLASLVELKYNPELFFSLDPSHDMDERIGRLLEATHHDRDAD